MTGNNNYDDDRVEIINPQDSRLYSSHPSGYGYHNQQVPQYYQQPTSNNQPHIHIVPVVYPQQSQPYQNHSAHPQQQRKKKKTNYKNIADKVIGTILLVALVAGFWYAYQHRGELLPGIENYL